MVNRIRRPPPIDRGWAWMIVVGTFLEVFCLIGVAKSIGLIMLELVRRFHISVAEAVMPATVLFTTYALLSPAALILGEIFSVRKVVIFGSVCGFVGMSLASLLYSVTYFTVLYGASIGLGGACLYGNGLLLLGKYFRRHRSLANGLAMSGASIGQFVLPPVIEYLLENYGLGGTTLISGAIFLNGAVSGALFRSIDVHHAHDSNGWQIAEIDETYELQVDGVESRDLLETSSRQDVIQQLQPQQQQHQEELYHQHRQPLQSQTEPEGKVPAPSTASPNGSSQYMTYEYDTRDIDTAQMQLSGQHTCLVPADESSRRVGVVPTDESSRRVGLDAFKTSPSRTCVHHDTPRARSQANHDDKTTGWVVASHPRLGAEDCSLTKGFIHKLKRSLDFTVLKSYVTLFYTFVSLLCFFGYMNVVLFLPAIFTDRGIERYLTAKLLSISGVAELISRISVGFLADRNWVPRYTILGTACFLNGLNVLFMSFADTFWWAAVHSFVYGLAGGTYICLSIVVMVDFVGLVNMSRNLVIVSSSRGLVRPWVSPFWVP